MPGGKRAIPGFRDQPGKDHINDGAQVSPQSLRSVELSEFGAMRGKDQGPNHGVRSGPAFEQQFAPETGLQQDAAEVLLKFGFMMFGRPDRVFLREQFQLVEMGGVSKPFKRGSIIGVEQRD